MIVNESVITCPVCGFRKSEEMSADSCQFFYSCPQCGNAMIPLAGDCCVFCSYGSVICPPKQKERGV